MTLTITLPDLLSLIGTIALAVSAMLYITKLIVESVINKFERRLLEHIDDTYVRKDVYMSHFRDMEKKLKEVT